jgi:prophage maintenance system killer protein
MDRLLLMHAEHEKRTVPVEVEAAWLHHRFAQIHPFADGNGRVARAITSLVFIKDGWFPLVVKRDDRARYIEALEKADAGDLQPLVAMFVEAQRNALIQATEVAYDVRPITSPHDAVIAARDRLRQRGKLPLREWLAAKETANKMLEFGVQRLGQIAQELQQEIGSIGTGFGFRANGGISNGYDNSREIVVQRAGHVANFGEYNALAQLTLTTGRTDNLVLSLHSIGPRYQGIIGVVAYFLPQGGEPVLIKEGIFQINYEEQLGMAQTRFSAWLERVIVEGLSEWRKTL